MTLEEIKARIAETEKEAEAFAAELGKPTAADASFARQAYRLTTLKAFLPELLREIVQRDQEIARLKKDLVLTEKEEAVVVRAGAVVGGLLLSGKRRQKKGDSNG